MSKKKSFIEILENEGYVQIQSEDDDMDIRINKGRNIQISIGSNGSVQQIIQSKKEKE